MRAANQRINLQGTSGRSRGPAEGLHYRLTEALNASTSSLAPNEELVTDQEFATVESWREAAKAAALGNTTSPPVSGTADLSEQECMTVLKDAADIVRGLVALDRRYENVPGWEKLQNQGRLGRAAEACAAYAGVDDPTTQSTSGLAARATTDGGPSDVRTHRSHAGRVQPAALDELPDAHSLRVVMDSNAVVAHEAALRAGETDPGLAAKWTIRSQTYFKLVKETRDLGGVLGKGNAAGQGAIAASRAHKLEREPLTGTKQLRQLDRLFDRIDERVCAVVEHGVKERLYFVRVPFPRVDDHTPGMVKGRRQRFVPITSPVQTDLIAIVRNDLRPEPARLLTTEGRRPEPRRLRGCP